MPTSDLILVDTNVLVYSFYQQRPEYAASRRVREAAQEPGAGLCVAVQNLAEFYAVVTNPKKVSVPYRSAEALQELSSLLALPGLTVLRTTRESADQLAILLRVYPVTAQDVHDVNLAATMLANGVHRLYTFDREDFARFAEIEVLMPLAT